MNVDESTSDEPSNCLAGEELETNDWGVSDIFDEDIESDGGEGVEHEMLNKTPKKKAKTLYNLFVENIILFTTKETNESDL
ncbi:MAG: hypothetical protein AAGA18_15330 [Verrucomicrobiota bacterium]